MFAHNPRVKSRIAAVLVLAVATGGAPAARAQEPSEKERIQIARDAFAAGQRALDAGKPDEAIASWKRGYETKDDPLFLLKIAQAYEQKGDQAKALFYYKGYLHDAPHNAQRANIEKYVADLEAHPRAAQPKPKPAPEPTPEPTDDEPVKPKPPVKRHPVQPKVEPTEDEDPHPGFGYKIGGIGLGAGGLVLTGIGVIFAVSASSIQSDLEASTKAGMPWSAEMSNKESSGRRDALVSKLCIGFGLAAMVGGVALYVVGGQKDDHAAAEARDARIELLPAVGPDSAGLVVRGAW